MPAKLAIRLWLLSLLAFTLNVTGCASTSERSAMDSWLGHSISEAIEQMGPATSISTDGRGGQIYSWVYGGGGAVMTSGFLIPAASRTRSYYVNEEGIIYNWYAR